MSIGIQAILHRANRGGVEKTIECTVHGIAEARLPWSLEFFVSDTLTTNLSSAIVPERMRLHATAYSSRPERILKEQILALSRKDILLWHFLGYVIPFFPPKGALVVSIYDIIALTHPELCTRLNRCFYSIMLPRTIRRADRIVVPSGYVRQRIVERFPESLSKIRVLPLPLVQQTEREVEVENDYLADKEYLLFLGDTGPKKNLSFLLHAYSLLPAWIRDKYPLHICGRSQGKQSPYWKEAVALGIEQQVHFAGYVNEADLPLVIKKAALLLYPSLEEGYGYPPLEAMAQGTPAVVSDRGAIPEIAGKAGAVVSPLDPEIFAGKILSLLTDSCHYEAVRKQGLKNTSPTTWADYAAQLGEIYAELL